MAEKIFVPKPGQTDYTGIRYCPVINCVLVHEFPDDGKKFLIVKRSANLEFYPNVWNGISGFLDDAQDFDAKVREELSEELGIGPGDIISIRRGAIFHRDARDIGKTWIVHPVLVEVNTDQVVLDWEHSEARWIYTPEIHGYEVLPGFDTVVEKIREVL